MTRQTIRNLTIVTTVIFVTGVLIGGMFFSRSGPGLRLPGSSMEVHEERTVSPDFISSLSVETTAGDIRVIEGESEVIRIILDGTARQYLIDGQEVLPSISLETEDTSLILGITLAQEIRNHLNDSRLALTVFLPSGYDGVLTVKTTSGDIEADLGTIEKMTVQSTSGNINIQALTAQSYNAVTTSGRMQAEEIQAENIYVKSTSGNLQIDGIWSTLHASTTSGNIRLESSRYPVETKGESTSGNLTFVLPNDADFSIHLQSVSGNLNCTFPVTEYDDSGNQPGQRLLNGHVNKPGNRIELKTVSGNISILGSAGE